MTSHHTPQTRTIHPDAPAPSRALVGEQARGDGGPVRGLVALAAVVVATLGLLGATLLIGQNGSGRLVLYAVYQGIGLAITGLLVLVLRLLKGASWPGIGDLGAPARAIRALGVQEGESWARVGGTFAILASVATGAYLWFAFGADAMTRPWTSWALALLIALPLSASNALVEEVVTRWGVLAAMPEDWTRHGPLASALLFGTIHWFGIPGGPIGALMAGFLAWVLARSILDTRGIGWAWFIHFCQDVLIFTTTLVLFV